MSSAAAIIDSLLTVVGSVNADIYLEVDRMPAKGETLSATDSSGYMLPGGKGANQAVACSKLAGHSRFIGVFGADAHADSLRRVLADNGVDVSLSRQSARPSGQAYIFLHSDGDNSIIIVGAANTDWPEDSPLSDDTIQAIRGASLLLLQREVPERINVAAARVAAENSVRVIMDVGGRDEMLDESILPHLFVLSPNETELNRITGMPTTTEEEVIVAARALITRGVRHVLVKLGARGSLMVSADTTITQAAIPPPKVVDTTGAGDAFTGAFAVALSEGKSFADAMRFAAATATLAIQRIGAMPSIPARAEVDELLLSS